jgi:hypothetical protein
MQMRTGEETKKAVLSEKEGNSSFAPGFYDPQYENGNPQQDEAQVAIQKNPSSDLKSIGQASTDESKEIIEIFDEADYLEESAQTEEQSDWDAVVIGATTAPKPNGDDEKKLNIRKFLSTGKEDFDVDYVASLPSTQRKDWVQDAQRTRRMKSRQDFMKVAYDSSSFSTSQLKNFLKSSKLNQDIKKMVTTVATNEETGTLASDRTKRIIFEKDSDKKPKKKTKEALLKEYKKQKLSILDIESDEESEDIQWEDASSQKDGFGSSFATKPRAILDDSSSSSDDEEGDGFLKNDAKAEAVGFFSTNTEPSLNRTAETGWTEDQYSHDSPSYDGATARGHGRTQTQSDNETIRTSNRQDEDAKLAQQLQDESLATALQNAEYEDDDNGESEGFLRNNEPDFSRQNATSRGTGGEYEDDIDENGGFLLDSESTIAHRNATSRGRRVVDLTGDGERGGFPGVAAKSSGIDNDSVPADSVCGTVESKQMDPVKPAKLGADDSSDEDNEIEWEDGMSDKETGEDVSKCVSDVSKPPPGAIDSADELEQAHFLESREMHDHSNTAGSLNGSIKPQKLPFTENGTKVPFKDSRSKNGGDDIVDTVHVRDHSVYAKPTIHEKSEEFSEDEEVNDNGNDGNNFMDSSDPWDNSFATTVSASNEVTEALTHAQDTASRL